MEFRILGPLSVRTEGQDLRLGGEKRRAVLALLLLHANRPVGTEQFLKDLWGEKRPPSAASTLHSQISHLRNSLGSDRLTTVPGGYQLTVREGELDAAVFEAEVEAARAALLRGSPTEAADGLAQAMARWCGPALTDVATSTWAAPEVARLDELRLVAQEMLLEAKLALGDEAVVVEQAQAAVKASPLRERLLAKLMLALYRCGRSADAVRAYQRLRSQLAREFGREPGEALVKLERAIVLHDPILNGPGLPTLVLTSLVPSAARPGRRPLPGGVLTFLMTDVVGSTRLWENAPNAMVQAMARHDELMCEAVDSHGGILLRERGEGDSTFSVFRRATDAAAAALGAQLALVDEPWPVGCEIQVRMALLTGEASERDGDYYGRTVNRAARLRAIAEGGQILVSRSTADIVVDHLPEGSLLVVLGPQALKDLERPETVYLLARPLRAQAPAPPGALDTPERMQSPIGTTLSSSSSPSQSPPLLWEAVIDADREYYEKTGADSVAFPEAYSQRVVALAAPIVLIGRRTASPSEPPGIDLSEPPEDVGVSRAHALLERQADGSYTLLDPGSTNGTFLNDIVEPIAPGAPIPLKSGDRIYVGAWTRILIRTYERATMSLTAVV